MTSNRAKTSYGYSSQTAASADIEPLLLTHTLSAAPFSDPTRDNAPFYGRRNTDGSDIGRGRKRLPERAILWEILPMTLLFFYFL